MEQKHVNLLVEGMNLDSHPSLQPSNSYREALNGNLISKGGNNYSYEYIDGTTFNWQMPEHKAGEGKFVPIGFLRMGNTLVVHSTDNVSSVGGDGEIGIVTFDNAGVGTYSAKYYHTDLKYTQAHMIFGYALEENDNYHRAYWTDDFNQPRTLNFSSAVITTEYSSGSLVIGNEYMVLTDSIGSVEHPIGSGNFYGPKQSLGNIFTATTTTFTQIGSAKIISYLDPIILDYTPAKAIGSINFSKYTFGGALYCGVKMYAYQLATDDGYEASWSFTLNPIHVGPSNPMSGGQADYFGRDGSINSGKAIELLISDIPTLFTKIKVAVIEIDDALDIISNIEIFWISDVSGTDMTITHYGQEALLPLDIDTLSLRNAVIMRCKDMTTVKQRQIIANLTEREELDWTPTATITPFVYEMPCDTRELVVDDYAFNVPAQPSAGIPPTGNIQTGGHYVVRGTGSITYNAVVVPAGETFIGVSGVFTYFVTAGVPIVKGCVRIKKYDKFGGGQEYQIIDIENEFFDHKGMASSAYLRGYWRDETYRTAAVAWDKFGNPYAARWIGDVTIPSQSDASGDFGLVNAYNSGTQWTIKTVGLRIDDLDITFIADKISGISIVRVPRDKTILAQSMLLQVVDLALGTTTCPVSTTDPANDNWASAVGRTTGYTWGLIGPEMDFGLSVFPLPLQSGDLLNPISDLSPVVNLGFDRAKVVLDQAIYSKYYYHNQYVGNSSAVVYSRTAGSGDSFSYNSGGFPFTFKNHDIACAGFCPPALGGAVASLQSKAAVGGMKTLMLTEAEDFINTVTNWGTGTGTGGSVNGLSTNRKLLVNYVRPKSVNSLYGGTSDVAKANNKYIFTGHYLRIDDTVLADIVDGSGNYILNGMEVFGGDCFVNLYDRVNTLYNSSYNATLLSAGSYSWGIIFPCESEINVGLRYGRHMSREGLYNNTNGVVWNDTATGRTTPQLEAFEYNTAYSSENSQIQYDALPVGIRFTNRFPYMARYSEQKILGETIDNMRKFLINNFKNVDAMHGEINNVAVGFDRLFYWQNKGLGYFPIEERETTVGALGQAVQLGVGGVMQRYDTMDKFYGNQHQSSLITGEDFFQWYDMRRFAILRMTFNGGIVDVSVVKGLKTFLQNAFKVAEPDAFSILNLDQPILGNGVIGVYDPIKKTAYHTFKFYSTEYGPSGDLKRNRDFTLGISTVLGKFVGFFSFAPVIYIEQNSKIYAVNKTRQGVLGLTTYNVGDEVVDSGNSYVCIEAFTSSDPLIGSDYPTALVRWKKTGQENEVHRMFNGETGKFFGVVYPWNISLVVNPMIDGQKSYDCCEAYGNDTPFSDVFCSTENLNGSDVDITPTNKNYLFYDGKWNFNLPLAGRQRMVDEYMIIKLQVKNYLTDITMGLNLPKRLVYLKTMFRLRK